MFCILFIAAPVSTPARFAYDNETLAHFRGTGTVTLDVSVTGDRSTFRRPPTWRCFHWVSTDAVSLLTVFDWKKFAVRYRIESVAIQRSIFCSVCRL